MARPRASCASGCATCACWGAFADAGIAAVLDDIIAGERWDHLQENLAGYAFDLVVLAPAIDVVTRKRDRERAKPPLGEEWARYLDSELRRTMAGVGMWLDSSGQSPEETVDEVVQRLGFDRYRTA